ncbi:MAG: hypothetical protein KME20_16070 [Kaiparowitsia implicata GSE-PSE-MK54-09C]|jgi:hypothetical protein|nr:hypothetical protein [Kaiparowitsia implicata GSE-PSE-MK54-09C]
MHPPSSSFVSYPFSHAAATAARHQVRWSQRSPINALLSIPPERIGLNGDHDHQGLAKRVAMLLRCSAIAREVSALKVAQRGAIVTIQGRFPAQTVLHQVVAIALQADGANGVEVNGTTILSKIDVERAYQDQMSAMAS